MSRPTLTPALQKQKPLIAFLALLLFLLTVTHGRAATPVHREGCQPRVAGDRSAGSPYRGRQATRCGARRKLGGARAVTRRVEPPIAIPPIGTTTPDQPADREQPPVDVVAPVDAPSIDTPPPVDVTPVDDPPVEDPPVDIPPVDDPLSPTTASAPRLIYWGAWVKNSFGEAPWAMAAESAFEQSAGKKVSLINWSSPFYLSDCNGYCAFQTNQFSAVRNHGAIPFFSWNPGPGGGNFTDAKIAAGSQDSYIRAWAQAAKSWGHPFFLRFAWEMNGSWFPWGVGNNGTTAANYVAMWRHVHGIFASVGATNVTWVWCPNIDPNNKNAPLSSVYPGDDYVDWTCLDGYNGANPWRPFSTLFKSSYDTITGTIAPSKPMLVGETGSTEAGGSKAQWISNMFATLPTSFPKVRGLLWFDKVESGPGNHSDWPIESSSYATSAFAAGIHDPSFAANIYASIGATPIPAP
jgi:hypothetical protein